MNHSGSIYNAATTMPGKIVHYALQPLILVAVLAFWLRNPETPAAYPMAILAVQVLIGLLERIMPARPHWLIGSRQMIINISLVLLLTTAASMVGVFYSEVLASPLSRIRLSFGMDIWPHHWPLAIQMFMVFLGSEFMWYWFHRAEHRWYPVWRLSGHGAHHSFKKLGALNFGLNHPLELFLLLLPSALIELTFGVGVAAAGAGILVATQASIAHANLDLNTKGIGWLFTTNRHHIHHHSVVMEESNTNYGCAAILWDRLFGTFADSRTAEVGTGPTEPGLMEKFLMPVREPNDTAIAPQHS